MRVPELPLPDDVPELPAGYFYRVERESGTSFPLYYVEVRREGRWFSHAVHRTDVRVSVPPGADVRDALSTAANRAHDLFLDADLQRATWREADKFVGDHGREATK